MSDISEFPSLCDPEDYDVFIEFDLLLAHTFPLGEFTAEDAAVLGVSAAMLARIAARSDMVTFSDGVYRIQQMWLDLSEEFNEENRKRWGTGPLNI